MLARVKLLMPQAHIVASQVVEHFKLLGRTVGKALQDNRLLDLPLNHVFYRGALGKQVCTQAESGSGAARGVLSCKHGSDD